MPRVNARFAGCDPSVSREGVTPSCVSWPRAAPQPLQNFAVVRLDAPHAGHRRGKDVPQTSQNLASSGF